MNIHERKVGGHKTVDLDDFVEFLKDFINPRSESPKNSKGDEGKDYTLVGDVPTIAGFPYFNFQTDTLSNQPTENCAESLPTSDLATNFAQTHPLPSQPNSFTTTISLMDYYIPELNNLEQTDIELTSNFAIGRWLAETFPETYDEFVEQQEDQFDLFCKKHKDYGPTNLVQGSISESVEGILIRMKDKLNRVHKLNNENAKPENESLIDSLNDISNYANIAIIFLKGKWGK